MSSPNRIACVILTAALMSVAAGLRADAQSNDDESAVKVQEQRGGDLEELHVRARQVLQAEVEAGHLIQAEAEAEVGELAHVPRLHRAGVPDGGHLL